jgi:putative phosphoribosyl transferase
MTRYYTDRSEAGDELALAMLQYAGTDAVIFGLPRGGVPVAAELARALALPLDVCVVRTLDAPGQPELAIGAVAEGPRLFLDRELVARCGVPARALWALTRRAVDEVQRGVDRLRGGRPLPPLHGRTAILVDDGVATGGTMRAAIRAVRKRGARHVVVAVPVGAREGLAAIERLADHVVCPLRPPELVTVGAWYADFHQISNAEAARTLAGARARERVHAPPVEGVQP